jgi:molybdopterin-guanine dinucleotide biosynthesis protein A
MKTAGIVLIGGRSTRMGEPKCALDFGGEPLLARVARAVAEAAGPVVVVAAPDQQLPPIATRYEVVRDEEEGRGPLAGLVAGLAAVGDRADAVFVASCDMPFLTAAVVKGVLTRLGPTDMCSVPRTDEHRHPLAAAYRVRPAISAGRELLAANELSLRGLLDRLQANVFDADPHPLTNVNTPQQYTAALRALYAFG